MSLIANTTYRVDPLKNQTPRQDKEREIEIIVQITRRLKREAGRAPQSFPDLVESLYLNRRLWQLFAADVFNEKNTLPSETKARIAYLSDFVQDYSRRVINEKLSVEPLVDVNLIMLRGLSNRATSI